MATDLESAYIGPNLVGVFGKPVLLDDGRTVIADENYVGISAMCIQFLIDQRMPQIIHMSPIAFTLKQNEWRYQQNQYND